MAFTGAGICVIPIGDGERILQAVFPNVGSTAPVSRVSACNVRAGAFGDGFR